MRYQQALFGCCASFMSRKACSEKEDFEVVREQPPWYGTWKRISFSWLNIHSEPSIGYSDDPATQFIDILTSAERNDKHLEHRLKSIISINGWTEALAESILRGVENVIKNSAKVAQAMADAIDRAESKALEFSKEHPTYTALIAAGTIVALGVLVVLAPWVLETLGFETLGPRAGRSPLVLCISWLSLTGDLTGSFAARWMSSIARSIGNVEKGSIYAFLQSLGMRWAK
ncbi:hypothetical protein HJFPF1_04483 [Paramyrothecium foliicola]|nr:hypothetical protein HJFPF1_04483 [Paramyrothecium foliicola]